MDQREREPTAALAGRSAHLSNGEGREQGPDDEVGGVLAFDAAGGHLFGGGVHSQMGGGRPSLMGPTDDMAICPVMEGRTVVKSVAEAAGLFRDYEGTRYWLCCAGCGPLFDADPQKYVAA